MWVQKKIFHKKGQRSNSCCINTLNVRLCSGERLWVHLQSFKQTRAYFAHSLGFPGGDHSKLKSCSHGQCFDEPGATGPAVRSSITVMGLLGFSCPGCSRASHHPVTNTSQTYHKHHLLPYSLRNKGIKWRRSFIFLLSWLVSHIFAPHQIIFMSFFSSKN